MADAPDLTLSRDELDAVTKGGLLSIIPGCRYWVGTLLQTGTSAPVVTTLFSSLSGDDGREIVAAYGDVGAYGLTMSDGATATSVVIQAGPGYTGNGNYVAALPIVNAGIVSEIVLNTFTPGADTLDDVLTPDRVFVFGFLGLPDDTL